MENSWIASSSPQKGRVLFSPSRRKDGQHSRQRSKDCVFSSESDDDSLILPENDDDAERKQLMMKRSRLSARYNAVSTEKERSKELVKNSLAGLSEKERAKHYNLCMKLTSENKINSKNVFGLHLIDYLSELVKKHQDDYIPNFQMASITLQASTRIYAVRVDCLHAETVKVAGCLTTTKSKGNADPSKNKFDGDGRDDVIGDEGREGDFGEGDSHTKQKAVKKRKKSFISENASALDCSITSTVEQPHNGFQLLTNAFDDSGVSGILLSLPSEDCGKIILSSEHTYFHNNNGESISLQNVHQASKSGKIMNVAELNHNMDFSPTLDTFSFFSVKWPIDDDTTLTLVDDTYTRELNVEFEKVCHTPNTEQKNCDFDDQYALEPNDAFDCQLSPPPDVLKQSEIPCDDDAVVPRCSNLDGDSDDQISGADGPLISYNLSNICKNSVAISPLLKSQLQDLSKSQYLPPFTPCSSEISVQNVTQCLLKNPTDYNCFDEPPELHFIVGQNILRAKYNAKLVKPRAVQVSKKAKEPFYITFESCESEELSLSMKNKFQSGKDITLSRQTVDNWDQHDTSLPFSYNEESDLMSLFTNPLLQYVIKPSFPIELNKDIGGINYNNEHENFCPQEMIGDLDDYEDSSCGPHELDEINLVPLPDRVKKDVISYAKIAKNVDQKLLKRVLWQILLKGPPHSGNKTNEREEIPSEVLQEPMKFDMAYEFLKHELPQKTRNDISVSIVFACLLHLANEKNLLIKSSEDLKNVTIMQVR